MVRPFGILPDRLGTAVVAVTVVSAEVTATVILVLAEVQKGGVL